MDKQLYIDAVIENHITYSFSGDRIISFFKQKFVSELTDQLFVIVQKISDHRMSKVIIHDKILHYIDTCFIQRSHKSSCITIVHDKREIADKLLSLTNMILPKQKTKEWYQYRNNLITASDMHKVFGSVASQNSLIFEKCKIDANTANTNTANTNANTNTNNSSGCSAMHWGNKYEAISVLFYEKKYNTVVSEFGCLPHQTIKHIGASPDGINSKVDNPRYGRMLEIKNTVSREITGIPKNEYWVQMQIQMEVCDLHECDLMETTFKECSESEYYAIEKPKGIIIQFTHPVTYYHSYCYLDIIMENEECNNDNQREEIKRIISEKNQGECEANMTTIIYYYLYAWSCVLVQRNRLWFMYSKQKIEQLWNIVKQEKITGYTHRAPKPRKKNIIHYDGFN
jgi:putative phage-type endonuclease